MFQNVRFLFFTILLLSTAYFSNAYAQYDMTPQQQSEMLQKLSPEQQDEWKSFMKSRTNSRKSRRSEKILNRNEANLQAETIEKRESQSDSYRLSSLYSDISTELKPFGYEFFNRPVQTH